MQWIWRIIKCTKFQTKVLFLAVILFLNSYLAKGQNNNQYRLYYFGSTSLNDKSDFSFGTGIHSMPQDYWKRLELRSTYSFNVASNLNVGLGQRSNVTLIENGLSTYEFRPFQKAMFQQALDQNLFLSHRIMVEERFFINYEEKNSFHARLRYRVEGNINFKHNSKYYIRPMSEIFYSFANEAENNLSQWKNTLALGYSVNSKASIEFRYEYVLNRDESTMYEYQPLNGFRLQFVHKF